MPNTYARLACAAVGASLLLARGARAQQQLQVLYDWRHAADPRNNPRDVPTLTYQTYQGSSAGGFLLKVQADLDGSRHNLSKAYVEATQTLRFWKPAVYVHLEYTGGLGLFDRATGGYYVDNAYLLGAAHPFRWGGAWASAYAAYRHTNTRRPSHDPQAALYWGRTLGGRWDATSTAVAWTQNRSRGDGATAALRGKRGSLFVEHGIWYRWGARGAHGALGARLVVSENVFAADDRLVVYPALGVRRLF